MSGNNIGAESHHALTDVKATSTILCYGHFWAERKTSIFCYQAIRRETQQENENDSDIDSDSVESSTDGRLGVENNEEEVVLQPVVGWQVDSDFQGDCCKQ